MAVMYDFTPAASFLLTFFFSPDGFDFQAGGPLSET